MKGIKRILSNFNDDPVIINKDSYKLKRKTGFEDDD